MRQARWCPARSVQALPPVTLGCQKHRGSAHPVHFCMMHRAVDIGGPHFPRRALASFVAGSIAAVSGTDNKGGWIPVPVAHASHCGCSTPAVRGGARVPQHPAQLSRLILASGLWWWEGHVMPLRCGQPNPPDLKGEPCTDVRWEWELCPLLWAEAVVLTRSLSILRLGLASSQVARQRSLPQSSHALTAPDHDHPNLEERAYMPCAIRRGCLCHWCRGCTWVHMDAVGSSGLGHVCWRATARGSLAWKAKQRAKQAEGGVKEHFAQHMPAEHP